MSLIRQSESCRVLQWALRSSTACSGLLKPRRSGGRVFVKPELTPYDVGEMYYAGIGVRLPLTNHYVTAAEYEASAPLLQTRALRCRKSAPIKPKPKQECRRPNE